jgi:type IV secretion system protein VirB5
MKYLFFITVMILGWPLCGFSTMPVIDASSIAQLLKQLEEMKRQYQVLQNTYQNARAHLDQTKQLTQNVAGHYGAGHLFNSINDLKQLQWSANRWEDTLKGLAGNNPARYQQLRTLYQQHYPLLDEQDFYQGGATQQYHRYQQTQQVNEAAHVQAAYVFETIEARLTRIHQLSQHIEKTDNIKASQDLNSRLLAEVAFIQLEMLKLQAVQSQQLMQHSANQQYTQGLDAQFVRLTR